MHSNGTLPLPLLLDARYVYILKVLFTRHDFYDDLFLTTNGLYRVQSHNY